MLVTYIYFVISICCMSYGFIYQSGYRSSASRRSSLHVSNNPLNKDCNMCRRHFEYLLGDPMTSLYSLHSSRSSDNFDRSERSIDNLDTLSFFPKDLYELAQDSSFSIKVALMGRISRLRIDIQTFLTRKSRHMMTYLLLLANSIIDDDIQSIWMFVNDEEDALRCMHTRDQYLKAYKDLADLSLNDGSEPKRVSDNINSISEDILTYNMVNNLRRIRILSISDPSIDFGEIKKKNSLFMICEPDNIYSENISSVKMMEIVQRTCLHAALRSVPVVIINPNLISTAWSDHGAMAPMLLSDFHDIYIIRDDYYPLNRKNRWCGMIYRYTVGLELFVLDNHVIDFKTYTSSSQGTFVRIRSLKDGAHYDVGETIKETLTLYFPNFVNNRHAHEYMNPYTSQAASKSPVASTENFSTVDENSKYSWRNIKPP